MADVTGEGDGAGLDRALGLGQVTASGVGIIIGAGIYVLVGEATALAGPRCGSGSCSPRCSAP